MKKKTTDKLNLRKEAPKGRYNRNASSTVASWRMGMSFILVLASVSLVLRTHNQIPFDILLLQDVSTFRPEQRVMEDGGALVTASAASFSCSDDLYSSGTHQTRNKKVVIIGGSGNVGMSLTEHLLHSKYIVTIFDIQSSIPGFNCSDRGAENLNVLTKHSREITKEEIQQYGSVIFFGGCTCQQSCATLSEADRYQANVQDVLDVVEKMSSDQHFLVASTSELTEGPKDEYSHSMHTRESKLREFETRRLNTTKFGSSLHLTLPQISVFRFGTVIGVSKGQRTDSLIPSLFRSAYTSGIINSQQYILYDAKRSFLWLPDLCRALQTAIEYGAEGRLKDQNPRGSFSVWHLASFEARILEVATAVATMTGAQLNIEGVGIASGQALSSGDTFGYQLFNDTFTFEFEGTLDKTLMEFDMAVPKSLTPKGPHQIDTSPKDSVPCPVCGSTDLQMVLDLGDQPFANDFLPDADMAIKSPRFPLKLVRCRVCNHYHLSHIASREDLFERYLYQSGTSTTLKQYFNWLSAKVKKESGNNEKGTILELACNDGTQLDSFRDLGWETYGVDPAENLVELAAAKNHTVKSGFWPLDFAELPKGNDLTAITAQNVLAHVPKPVDFLKGCASVMGPNTKLYIQTSQCNMQQLGQFDTVYHEHISFFTGHSFLKSAELAGLQIIEFATTPIHGESCLVTMMLNNNITNSNVSRSLGNRLMLERNDGINIDFFAEKYSTRANLTRKWICKEIAELRFHGYTVGGYGAAAKGMTLLHYIQDGLKGDPDPKTANSADSFLDFILDDAPLKQNRYCPGTSIPVRGTDMVRDLDGETPLAIVILAWNFWDEIARRLLEKTMGIRKDMIAVIPFPTPRVVRLSQNEEEPTIIREMPYHPTPIPNPFRKDSTNRIL